MLTDTIAVRLPSLAGPVPIPGPLMPAALLLRHVGLKGVALDTALRFIGRRRTAAGSHHFVTDRMAAEIDGTLPRRWGWAVEEWELMARTGGLS